MDRLGRLSVSDRASTPEAKEWLCQTSHRLRLVRSVDPPPTPGLRGLTASLSFLHSIWGKDVLLPVTLAVLSLGFLLVTVLRRIHIPRAVAVVFSVALAIAIIVGVGTLVATQFVEIAGDLPRYQSTIEEKVGGLQTPP